MNAYDRVAKVVAPKQIKLKEAEAAYEEASAAAAGCRLDPPTFVPAVICRA